MKIVDFRCKKCGKKTEGFDNEKPMCCGEKMQVIPWPNNNAPTVGVK